MKATLILLVLFAVTFAAVAQDGDYRFMLKRAHDRLDHLETERRDYRKPKPELPPDLEKERLQLIGQLTENDPLWVLLRDLEADVVALAAARETEAKQIQLSSSDSNTFSHSFLELTRLLGAESKQQSLPLCFEHSFCAETFPARAIGSSNIPNDRYA